MSSVRAPGLTALPPSSSAPAAIRPATRIASMTSAGCTWGSVLRAGVGLPTYSGRSMCAGTGLWGVWTPGLSGARTDIPSTLRRSRRRDRQPRLLRRREQPLVVGDERLHVLHGGTWLSA